MVSTDVLGWRRCDYHGILKESTEQLPTGARSSAVKPKGELVEIIIKV